MIETQIQSNLTREQIYERMEQVFSDSRAHWPSLAELLCDAVGAASKPRRTGHMLIDSPLANKGDAVKETDLAQVGNLVNVARVSGWAGAAFWVPTESVAWDKSTYMPQVVKLPPEKEVETESASIPPTAPAGSNSKKGGK